MNLQQLIQTYSSGSNIKKLVENLLHTEPQKIHLKGLVGSIDSFIAIAMHRLCSKSQLFILNDKEEAVYFYNDLQNILVASDKVLFFPSSFKKSNPNASIDNSNVLQRINTLSRLSSKNKDEKYLLVTYPEALEEKVVDKESINKNILEFKLNQDADIVFLAEVLHEYGFKRNDFVYEAGDFSIRGGIIDVFSYGDNLPYRLELFGNKIESIRTFNPANQLSVSQLTHVLIVPNLQKKNSEENRSSFLKVLPENTIVWIRDVVFSKEIIDYNFGNAEPKLKLINEEVHTESETGNRIQSVDNYFINGNDFLTNLADTTVIEFGNHFYFNEDISINFSVSAQPHFHKNFKLLSQDIKNNTTSDFTNIIFTDTPKQAERLTSIFNDVEENIHFYPIHISLRQGFIDKDLKLSCYTDHQIFDRFHPYKLKDSYTKSEAITLKELRELSPGDYVTHIDHGIGRFAGLELIEVNNNMQEAICIVYKDNDLLYVNIHSLYKISKYKGKEGSVPQLNKLGSPAWQNLKKRTKGKVKDIAKDLIKLYAQRKAQTGNAFSPDTYLQTELEASFIYEDTPDQLKATQETKKDMEEPHPMDRLICGDVGFGKTEIAIRAAFKAITDSKQVAILTPTTILTTQHYRTFSERLKEFPCNIDFLNRFKSASDQKETLKKLANGQIDIIIGTHRLVSKDVKFKNLGLLIIDEEQKFGVTIKEKLRQMRVNVDTLTLTATPIPRTLQFSLLGARDLSIINTAPPNRLPIHTELHVFDEQIIQKAIINEVRRGGQVFFVHNHINNIHEIADMLRRLCPDMKIAVGHGQMENKILEKVIVDFIDGNFDVLVSTTIIESGLDIPNANTIIINQAHTFGLGDLYQMRGRVGRSNIKAFCYLLAPPISTITPEARKRLNAIEEFTDLGSGLSIAMRDLDIRGAGNLLGAEQSGFISEIGFDMYQKILNEAIQELHTEELISENVYEEKPKQLILKINMFVNDCQIETDLQILIPDSYVNNISERLKLYNELNSINEEEKLKEFSAQLSDRFGTVPNEIHELINTIRLRWIGAKIGFQKIIIRNKIFNGYFPVRVPAYFESQAFTSVLEYVHSCPDRCKLKQKDEKLILQIKGIECIKDAIDTLMQMPILSIKTGQDCLL